MKILLTTLAAAILCVSCSPPARAQGSVSVDLFYESLEPHGQWLDVGNYGYVWQPQGIQSDWSPYSDGRWVYTDAGWTWDSYEPYGWAVYHYGRWANLRRVGWVWVPGIEWGPAWVSWRHSSSYVGWAPLPPEARFSSTIGFSSWVDDYYDIGPGHYRFVEGRHLGSRHLNRSFIDNSRNLTLINETTNITNITYQNNVIYNAGPVYEDQLRLSSEPIPRYRLDRRQSFDGNLRELAPEQLQSRVEGETFIVAAPELVAGGTASAPATVAERVEVAEIDHGWADEGSAEEAAARRTERLARAELPDGLPPEPTFERTPRSSRADAARSADSPERAQPDEDAVAPRPVTPGVDGPGNAGPDQPGRPGPRGRMAAPSTEDPSAVPRPPTPRSEGDEAIRPDSPPVPPRSMRRPQEGQPGRPEATTPGATPSRPDPQAQPSRPPAPGSRPGRPEATTPGATPSSPDPQAQPSRPPAPGSRPGRPEATTPGATPSSPDPQARPPRPPTPGSAPGKGKSARPSSPPPSSPEANPPGEERQRGRPEASTPGATPRNPDPQPQPSRPPAPGSRQGRPEASTPAPDRAAPAPRIQQPRPAPQEPAGRPTRSEPDPERPTSAGGKGKRAPSPVPPPEIPAEEPEKEKGKGKR